MKSILKIEIESIKFSEDSKLQTIENASFYNSTIEEHRNSIRINRSQRRMVHWYTKLNRISVSSFNTRYCCLDEKMIISKKSEKSINYNCLVFCVRDIKTAIIPNFIKYICSYAFNKSLIEAILIPFRGIIGKGCFSNCKKLKKKTEFSSNSKIHVQRLDLPC